MWLRLKEVSLNIGVKFGKTQKGRDTDTFSRAKKYRINEQILEIYYRAE